MCTIFTGKYNSIRTKKKKIIQLIKSMSQNDHSIHFLSQSNQSNRAFYQSKGLLDWSLDEPMVHLSSNETCPILLNHEREIKGNAHRLGSNVCYSKS